MSEEFLTGFAPVVGKHARVLILGSMPSVASLALGRYYGHPRNRFWPLMAALFPVSGEDLLADDFDRRYKALTENGIALWDTIGRCRREGSLDSAIRDWIPNDIEGLLERYPQIDTILLNGRKSEAVWKKSDAQKILGKYPGLKVVTLPSTSPANAAMTLQKLVPLWRGAMGLESSTI